MECIMREDFETSLKTVIEGLRYYLYCSTDYKTFEENGILYGDIEEVYITLKDIYEVI